MEAGALQTYHTNFGDCKVTGTEQWVAPLTPFRYAITHSIVESSPLFIRRPLSRNRVRLCHKSLRNLTKRWPIKLRRTRFFSSNSSSHNNILLTRRLRLPMDNPCRRLRCQWDIPLRLSRTRAPFRTPSMARRWMSRHAPYNLLHLHHHKHGRLRTVLRLRRRTWLLRHHLHRPLHLLNQIII